VRRFSVRYASAVFLAGACLAAPLTAKAEGGQQARTGQSGQMPLPVPAKSGLSAHDQAIYRAAFAAVHKDRWKEARQLADTATNPLLAKVIQWMDLTRPGPGRSFYEMTGFLAHNPDWPMRDALLAQAERAMPVTYTSNDILQWFGERDPQTAQGALALGGALVAAQQTQRASLVLRRAWVEEDFDAETETELLKRFGGFLEMRDHRARMDRLLWDGARGQAQRMLTRIDPAYRLVAEARMKLADQVGNINSILAQIPKELRRDPGLVYEEARWYRRKNAIEKAADVLDPPPEGVLRPAKMWDESEKAARGALDRGAFASAYRLAAGHGAENGETFAEGEWLAGWIALRFMQDSGKALEHFTRLYAGVKSGVSRARGAYWAGRAAEAHGDLAMAQDWYHTAAQYITTFYGQLAAVRLGENINLHLPQEIKPTTAQQSSFDRQEFVQIARLLAAIDEKDLIKPFLLKLTQQAKEEADYTMTAALAREVGRNDTAIASAKEARQHGIEMINYLYPIVKLPPGNQPEPAFILGLVRQESAFAVDAVSQAGAKGMMQLLPETARAMARTLSLHYDERRLESDASYNITLGRAYLDQLIDRFGGSYMLALAAYNAGPSRAREWMTLYGDPRQRSVDIIDWIERIPFDETRNYIQRVMENLQVYRSRLNNGRAQITLDQDLQRASAD